MNEIEQLIEIIRINEREAQTAVSRLVAIGMPAVPAILDAIRKSTGYSQVLLQAIISQIHDPQIVSKLIEILNDANIDLVMTAFQSLGKLKDSRALRPLLDYLKDTNNLETRRSLAAKALGELGDTKAIADLRKIADEAIRDHMPNLAISTVIALAKLGNREKVSVAISLTTYRDDPIIRADAVGALQYTVGPGIFPALQRAIKDSYIEVRSKAVNAMFYLGVKEAIPDLISRVNDKDSRVSNNVLNRLYDLTGEEFDTDTPRRDLLRWWKRHQTKFDAGICYRLGEPIWLPNVIALLEEPNTQYQIIEELRIITGTDFGFNSYIPTGDQEELLDRAQKWWKKEGHRFEEGQLYKYGYKQNIQDIF